MDSNHGPRCVEPVSCRWTMGPLQVEGWSGYSDSNRDCRVPNAEPYQVRPYPEKNGWGRGTRTPMKSFKDSRPTLKRCPSVRDRDRTCTCRRYKPAASAELGYADGMNGTNGGIRTHTVLVLSEAPPASWATLAWSRQTGSNCLGQPYEDRLAPSVAAWLRGLCCTSMAKVMSLGWDLGLPSPRPPCQGSNLVCELRRLVPRSARTGRKRAPAWRSGLPAGG